MNIWYLNHYATDTRDGRSGRENFFASVLTDLGHRVLVVGAAFHHCRARPLDPSEIGRVLNLDGTDFLFLPARPYQGNGVGRYMNMQDFAKGVRSLATRVDEGSLAAPDVIIASSAHMFVYPPARRLAKRLKAKVVFEVRDLWPSSLVELAGVHRWHPLVKLMERIECNAYTTADAVVSLLPSALLHMQPKGLPADRFHWIPNGVWSAEWNEEMTPLPEEHQKAIERCRAQGKLVVVYAGAHGPPNALDQVLDLAHVPCANRPYHFLFVGKGVLKPSLMARADREGIDFVTFLPDISKSAARAMIHKSDACFIGWQDKPIYRFGISPNKLFEYLMASKPVLHAIGQPDDAVQSVGAGFSVHPYCPTELDAALRRLAAMSPSERQAMGARGREYVLARHEWSVLGKSYADLCETLVRGEARPEGASV